MELLLRTLMIITLLLQSICVFLMAHSVYKNTKRDAEFYRQLDKINNQILEDLKIQPAIKLINTEEETKSEQEDPNKK